MGPGDNAARYKTVIGPHTFLNPWPHQFHIPSNLLPCSTKQVQICSLLDRRMIIRVDPMVQNKEFCSTYFLVQKKDGDFCPFLHFRKLNYPILFMPSSHKVGSMQYMFSCSHHSYILYMFVYSLHVYAIFTCLHILYLLMHSLHVYTLCVYALLTCLCILLCRRIHDDGKNFPLFWLHTSPFHIQDAKLTKILILIYFLGHMACLCNQLPDFLAWSEKNRAVTWFWSSCMSQMEQNEAGWLETWLK